MIAHQLGGGVDGDLEMMQTCAMHWHSGMSCSLSQVLQEPRASRKVVFVAYGLTSAPLLSSSCMSLQPLMQEGIAMDFLSGTGQCCPNTSYRCISIVQISPGSTLQSQLARLITISRRHVQFDDCHAQGVSWAIQNGCILSRARIRPFKHNDMNDLRKVLQQEAADHKRQR